MNRRPGEVQTQLETKENTTLEEQEQLIAFRK